MHIYMKVVKQNQKIPTDRPTLFFLIKPVFMFAVVSIDAHVYNSK